jgi:CheY-like chemotaxis protein
VLTVSDTGRGMPPDVARHLFEPFFTTKEPAHGNGLGLSQVYGAVRQSRGFIQVETAPGVGTTVRIYLPLEEALAAGEVVDGAGLPRGSESILVVEDEPAVRALARKMLERSGYRVTDAATPTDAESIFEAGTSDFDLLLTDVVMPGMAGPDLYERLAARKPSLKVVYMSGYTDNTTVRVPGLDGYLPFTQKPFSASTLVRKVREALDR